jgi:uncharacterized protein (DUF58 family)
MGVPAVQQHAIPGVGPEVLAMVRELEVRARPSVREGLGGRWTSAVRGPGVEFAEVREYVAGDDARMVDWNVSARTGRLHVKRFDEEREQTLLFLVDQSSSCTIGQEESSWGAAAAEVLALLGLAAAEAGDRIGALEFSRGIERVIPPRHGTTALLTLLARWLERSRARDGGGAADLEATLQEFLRLRTRPSLLLLLTDLSARASEATWRAVARRHDLVVLALRPAWFDAPPERGLLRLQDPASGASVAVDFSDARVRAAFVERLARERRETAELLARAGAELVELSTAKPRLPPLLAWTRSRARRSHPFAKARVP